MLLGPRQYDPKTERFTTADTFVASGIDMALGTDPLTGNRYLFAAANPVAFYENGYEPCPKGANCNKMYSGGSTKRSSARNVLDYTPILSPLGELLDKGGDEIGDFLEDILENRGLPGDEIEDLLRNHGSKIGKTFKGFAAIANWNAQWRKDDGRGDLNRAERFGRLVVRLGGTTGGSIWAANAASKACLPVGGPKTAAVCGILAGEFGARASEGIADSFLRILDESDGDLPNLPALDHRVDVGLAELGISFDLPDLPDISNPLDRLD